MKKSKRRSLLLGIILWIMVSVSNIFFAACETTSSTTWSKSEFAEIAAQQVIYDILKAPSSAIWNKAECLEYDENGKYLVYVDVEASNSFGGMIRQKYFVCVYDLNVENKTFRQSKFAPYVECTGINDETNLLLLKTFNEYDETTAKKVTEDDTVLEDDAEIIGVLGVILFPLVIVYCVLYFGFYKKGKLQNWEKMFIPFVKLETIGDSQEKETMQPISDKEEKTEMQEKQGNIGDKEEKVKTQEEKESTEDIDFFAE